VTLSPSHIQHIQELLHGRILTGALMSRFSSFRIGGPADLVAEPQDAQELAALLQHL